LVQQYSGAKHGGAQIRAITHDEGIIIYQVPGVYARCTFLGSGNGIRKLNSALKRRAFIAFSTPTKKGNHLGFKVRLSYSSLGGYRWGSSPYSKTTGGPGSITG
jgi:hypothetical protein